LHTEQTIALNAETFKKILSVSVDNASLLNVFTKAKR